MRRENRLRTSAEFQRARQRGRASHHPLLALYALSTGSAVTRVGISVSKRIGKAVTRNRVKRLIRESLRRRGSALRPGWDLLFVAREGAAGAKLAAIDQAVGQVLRRVGAEPAAGLPRASGPGPGAIPSDEREPST